MGTSPSDEEGKRVTMSSNDLPGEDDLAQARSQLEPRELPADFIGYCIGCGKPCRSEEVFEEVCEGVLEYVCPTCGSTVDERPPF
jgi:hypothetical protein